MVTMQLMVSPSTKPNRSGTSYEEDFFGWTQEQARLLREAQPNSLDWENVAEEIESLGKRDRLKIESQIERAIQHLLKWAYQPERRGTSWRVSIHDARMKARRLLKDSPSLRSHPSDMFDELYEAGRRRADIELDEERSRFPIDPPFTIEQVLNPDWLPNDMPAP